MIVDIQVLMPMALQDTSSPLIGGLRVGSLHSFCPFIDVSRPFNVELMND
jgi:hypothetical protein